MSGLRDLPGLPVAELSELKHTVFLQFHNSGRMQLNLSRCGRSVQMLSTSRARNYGKGRSDYIHA